MSDDSRPRNATAIAFGGLIALAAGMGIGRFVYTPVLPFMEEALGLTKPQAGIIASVNFLGYLLGALAAAWSALPGGRRGWLLGALAVSAVTTGAMGLTASMAMFLGLRFVGGVASAFVLVFASALILDRLAAAGRPGLSAVHFAGVGVGIAVSAVIVSGLSVGGADWQAQWIVSGAVALVAFVAVVWLVPHETEPERPAAIAPSAGVERRLAVLILAYGLFGFGYVITATFISTTATNCPTTASPSANFRFAAPGSPAPISDSTIPTPTATTAGSPPETSAPSTRTATSKLPTARKTSSNPAASGSVPSSWRMSPWATRTCCRRR